ncbi:uncharacterized protein [Engystomops pustulosus]|uniref:uncharacterized protein isoform X2 n=1 Tax=Engystomops pustulosus TaxID=76066 RepID=UPI003AFB361C
MSWGVAIRKCDFFISNPFTLRRGRPGYNLQRPNFARNRPFNMAGRGYGPGFRFGPPRFPVHTRPNYFHDVQFAENPDVHGNSFCLPVGPNEMTPKMWREMMKKKKRSQKTALKQLPKQEEKAPEADVTPEVPKKKKSKKLKIRLRKLRAKKLQKQAVANQPQNSAAATVTNPQQQKPTGPDQPQGAAAKNPPQPSAASTSQQAPAQAKPQKRPKTLNGDMKKGEAAAEKNDAEAPNKKPKTEETNPPANQSEVVTHWGWRDDPSTMFSCSLCRYNTVDESEIQKHFYSYPHRAILKNLTIFFPRDRVDFLHDYLVFKNKRMAKQRASSIVHSIKEEYKALSQDHYLHRIQATHCHACDVLIPDSPGLLAQHVRSDAHQKNRKLIVKSVRQSCIAAAKELLMDKELLQMHRKLCQGINPFKDAAFSSAHESSTQDILVAEEDEDLDEDNDSMAETSDGREGRVVDNEAPGHENSNSENKTLPEAPETPSLTVIMEPEEEEEEAEAAEAP